MASTGGQLTPSIMGIAVFVTAGFLGTSYADLMFKAVIPAVAYYVVAVLGVVVVAFRESIPRSREIADGRMKFQLRRNLHRFPKR
ncbi:MAG: TRAP transporter large permease subunit [Proteobacteria bacterium]|nr:TRAP transporter large permease subunit [Pseudomonadota bacterium]